VPPKITRSKTSTGMTRETMIALSAKEGVKQKRR
jgi:hypothetical protein